MKASQHPELPLARYRVIEIGTGSSLAYAGKLLAAFGAEVIKLEPRGGDPGRAEPPLVDVGEGRMESAYFAWLNAGKQSVCMADDAARALIADADLLLDGRPPGAGADGVLAHAALRADYPALTIVAISWFGESGPYRDYLTTDATCRALAGLIHLIGPAERPVGINDHQADIVGGLAAYIAALAGLLGGGRRFELSIHEAAMALSETHTAYGPGGPRARLGNNRFSGTYPIGVFKCREGWLGVGVSSPQQWRAFCELFDMPDAATNPNYAIGIDRSARHQEIEARFVPKLLERSAAEWFAEGLKRKIPFAIVPEMHELLAQKVFRDDGAFARIAIGDASFEGPGVPLRLTRTPPRSSGMAPLTGSSALPPLPHPRPLSQGERGESPHQLIGMALHARPLSQAKAEVLPDLPVPADTQSSPLPSGEGPGVRVALAQTRSERIAPISSAPPGQPLAGLRIVDLTMGWAGPLVTRHMADLGAEVIKIEACRHPDWWRGQDPRASFFEQKLYEKRPNFLALNRNKLGITLDLTKPEGVALVKRLVGRADAVVENYARGVAVKLGLGYEALRAVQPELVMVSMPAFRAGPWENARAYGFTLEQASGLPTIAGNPDGPPLLTHYAYGDPIGGLNATAALLTALIHRSRSGQGQHIDISQVECLFPMAAPWMIEQSVTGRVGPRLGNRHPRHVPQNCFRCAGDDAFVHVAITDDAMWLRLCDAIVRPDLATDATLATAAARRAREDEIEAAIEAWARGRDADEVMRALQAQRIAAGVVRSPYDLGADPHLHARGFWQPVDRAFCGPHLQASLAFREADTPYAVRHASPTMGEHNAAVLGGILGLSDAELARLASEGIIGTEALPPHTPPYTRNEA